LTRRLSNGLQFQGSYTWSHALDNATDALDSTVLSPRRPQDSQNLRPEWASSLLDHRNRIVLELLYDAPYFKNRNWFMKNIIGNWEIAPVYMFQTGEPVTAQSAVDSNLNVDSAPDRTIINPAGAANLGTGVTPLTAQVGGCSPTSATNPCPIVGFVANNPNARYVQAPEGTLANAGRNTLTLNPINDIDLTLVKRFNITERFRLEFSARAFNILNHPQYTGGFLDDVAPVLNGGEGAATGNIERPSLEPQSTLFQQWSQTFSSNPRQLQLALKLIF
jgi:hypothetical protein